VGVGLGGGGWFVGKGGGCFVDLVWVCLFGLVIVCVLDGVSGWVGFVLVWGVWVFCGVGVGTPSGVLGKP